MRINVIILRATGTKWEYVGHRGNKEDAAELAKEWILAGNAARILGENEERPDNLV